MDTGVDIREKEQELDQRIALLRRYRRMMELQRERFQDYLDLLDTREAAIRSNSYESLEDYAVREQQVVKGIMSVQDCLQPLAEMYVRIFPEGSPDIDELVTRLDSLKHKVLARNAESLAFLKAQARKLKDELASVKQKTGPLPVFGAEKPVLVDIQG